ncbi:MAG: SDR family NAD(P)-dependent oxidoreductase [Pseudomonadota bacterium]
MAVLVTGAAGFIGFHTSKALLDKGQEVVGVDNLNDYYPPKLKRDRLAQLTNREGFRFIEADIADHDALTAALENAEIEHIVHLAAQAGVRYSIENPFAYVRSNLMGHVCILELARALKPRHTVYASSSSVYGANEKTPFSETDMTDAPVSLYGATKKSDELLSASYAKLYKTPLTGLRFFTVYGPWGRPDMAYWLFTKAILAGEPIRVFNHGKMARDFTYIDDIVDGVLAALAKPPTDPETPHKVYNLGNNTPEPLGKLIGTLENALGREAEKRMEPMQKGDVERTWADLARSGPDLGFQPKIKLEDGLQRFVDWYRAYYDV